MQDRCQHPDSPHPPPHRAGRPSLADKEWAYVVPTEPPIDALVPHKRKRKG
jgi:hypothetical protein